MLVDKGCTRVCCCLFCGGRSWGLQLCLHFSGGTAAAAVSIAVEVCKQRRGKQHCWLEVCALLALLVTEQTHASGGGG